MRLMKYLIAVLALLTLASAARAVAAESSLTIEAALDFNVAEPLIRAFEATHPNIRVSYHDSSTLAVDRRARDGSPPADVYISSAMPWQVALANQGRAARLDLPEARQWPEWAKWRNEVFGFTFEPVVIAYRLDLARHTLPPQTHRELLQALQIPQLQGRVTTYDPESSGVGYSLFQQDARYSPRFWDLVAAMGARGVTPEATSRAMLEGLSEGRYWLGYNLLGSYAIAWARHHPEVIVQVPTDYSLVLLRTALVARNAPHPQAARLFMAFLLGPRGQHVLAGQTPLFSPLDGVVGPWTAARLRDQVGDHLYPIPLDASLLAFVDPLRRDAFMRRWAREITILDRTGESGSSSSDTASQQTARPDTPWPRRPTPPVHSSRETQP